MVYLIRYNGKSYHPSALDSMRHHAMAAQDSLSYAMLCDVLGINPEDIYLYEVGLAERLTRTCSNTLTETESSKPTKSAQSIDDFLKASGSLRINNFEYDVEEKRALLLEYFPSFRQGNKDITKFDDVDVGAIFRNVYISYSKKKEGKK